MAQKISPEATSRIKELVDPQAVLDYLGFHIVRRNGKELRGPCKIHGGDNPSAFRFNLDTRTWCCYTRHCEGDQHRDLVGLVQLAGKQNFVESVRFLANIAGIDLNDTKKLTAQFIEKTQERQVKKFIRESKPAESSQGFYPEEVVQGFLRERSSYFLDRGFPEELLDFFQIGGMTDRYGVHRETIPIRDPEGNVLTVSARRTDGDDEPKYLLLYDIKKTDTLYNLDVARLQVGLPRTLLLVEGFVDVWNLALHGVWNVVAAMGTSLAPNQVRLLSRYADQVLILPDADQAGKDGAERMKKMLEMHVGVSIVENDTDPKLLNAGQVAALLEGYISDV